MKQKFTVKAVVEVAIYAAIAFACDLLAGGIFRFLYVNGGSISIAMLPIIIITYRRGFIPGLICGLIVSILQLLGGVYAIAASWWKVLLQIGLDYLLTYPLVALCFIFKKPFDNAESTSKKNLFLVLGVVVAGLAKFLCHFLAGVIFWGDACEGTRFAGQPVLFSILYNGGYMLPNIIICSIILVIIYKLQPQLVEKEVNYLDGDNNE